SRARSHSTERVRTRGSGSPRTVTRSDPNSWMVRGDVIDPQPRVPHGGGWLLAIAEETGQPRLFSPMHTLFLPRCVRWRICPARKIGSSAGRDAAESCRSTRSGTGKGRPAMQQGDSAAAVVARVVIAHLQPSVQDWMDADQVLPADGSALLAALDEALAGL